MTSGASRVPAGDKPRNGARSNPKPPAADAKQPCGGDTHMGGWGTGERIAIFRCYSSNSLTPSRHTDVLPCAPRGVGAHGSTSTHFYGNSRTLSCQGKLAPTLSGPRSPMCSALPARLRAPDSARTMQCLQQIARRGPFLRGPDSASTTGGPPVRTRLPLRPGSASVTRQKGQDQANIFSPSARRRWPPPGSEAGRRIFRRTRCGAITHPPRSECGEPAGDNSTRSCPDARPR